MKVTSSRVYLDMPQLPETKIELSPEMKKELREELTTKFDRLKVFAVGRKPSSETAFYMDDIRVGDEVFVDPGEARRAVICNIEGKDKMIVPFHAILHVW
jgi:hypothetical protein